VSSGPAISRWRLLAGCLAAGAGLAVSGVGGLGLGRASERLDAEVQPVPFYGPHQAGIATAAQERIRFAAFDVVCFQRDPRTDFVPVQTRLAAADALHEYSQLVGSGLFAIPPGITGRIHRRDAVRLDSVQGAQSGL
jgi:deferrochelatase/peroxidase EfeB